MTKNLPFALFGLGCWLLPLLSSTHAQNAAAVTPATATATIDQALTQTSQIDAELLKKIEALRTIIDQETAAGRITDQIAQTLRYSQRNMTLSSEFTSVLGTLRAPAESPALLQAIKSLEIDWTAAQTRRMTLFKGALAAAGEGLSAAVQTATKPADVDPLITLIERLQQTAPTRLSAYSSAISGINLSSYAPFLRALRRVLEAQAQPDPVGLGSALNEWQNSSSNLRNVIGETEVQQRIKQTLAPFQKSLDEAQEALDQMLRAGKPSAEITTALTKFEEAVERNQQARANINYRTAREMSSALGTYRNFAAIVSAIEAAQWTQARNNLSNVRGNLQALGAVRAGAYTQQISAWEKAIDDGSQKAATKRREELRARIAAVKKPADLEALASELIRVENEYRDGREPEIPRGVGGLLNSLAVAWASANPNLLRQTASNNVEARLNVEIGGLRERIEREVLTTALQVPELGQPPLAELPIDQALEKLTVQLAAKGEWRRLLQIIEGRSSQARYDGYPTRDTDLAGALRAYLAGQNFELAEQWADALQSYKTVLRSTSERAPIKAAAERVKALVKEHPEVVTPPSSTSPPNVPPAMRFQ